MTKEQQKVLNKYRTTIQGVKGGIKRQVSPKDLKEIMEFVSKFLLGNETIMRYENK